MLGYFPDSAVEKINQIRLMKEQGLTMSEIVARIGTKSEQPAETLSRSPRQARVGFSGETYAGEKNSLQVTLEDILHPAYMVNYNFELTWYNEAARKSILRFDVPPPDSESRNIFPLLMAASEGLRVANRDEFLRLHITFAKARLSKENMLGIVKGMDRKMVTMIEDLYENSDGPNGKTIVEVPYTLKQDSNPPSDSWLAYGIYFREGILIVHVPPGQSDSDLMQFLSRRDVVIRNLLRKRLPVLTQLAVLVADLQNSVKICSELPPEEYFELINEIWAAMTPIFRKYYGTYGKHVGDGMVYYFFPQPDSSYTFNALACAYEIKLEMRRISKDWQLRKNWLNELYLNIGLHEGQEWLGTFQSATSIEFTVLGDTINHTSRLSDFARYGAIWATKNLVSKLSTEDRIKIEFGIVRRGEGGREHFVVSSYSQLGTLVDLNAERYEKLREISTLAITEVRAVLTGA